MEDGDVAGQQSFNTSGEFGGVDLDLRSTGDGANVDEAESTGGNGGDEIRAETGE